MTSEYICNQHLVSVIIPTYNRSGTIERSIYSVLSQTYTNLEVIVIDDGSTDCTASVVSGISDPRLQYHKNKSRMGACAARNKGIQFSKGEFIAFQDSDDEWLLTKLEKQVSILKKQDQSVSIVYSGLIKIDQNFCSTYIPGGVLNRNQTDIIKHITWKNFVCTPTLLCKKDILESVGGFDESLPRFQDWDLVLSLANITHFEFVEEPLVVAHHTAGNISSCQEAELNSKKIILKKHTQLFIKKPLHFIKIVCCIIYLEILCKTGNTKDSSI